jgi:hypothetical protein
MTNPCNEIMPDGTKCKAYEAKGSGYCAGHARKRGLLTFEKKVNRSKIDDALQARVGKAIDDGVERIEREYLVDEPGPLAALRQITIAMERGEDVDPIAATQLANLLRPYLGIAPLDSVQLVGQIDARRAADEQVAEREKAERFLLERSLSLVQDNPDPKERERVLAKATRDLEMASANFRTRMQMQMVSLKNEKQDEVYGSGEDELYSVNGVRVVVPAEGQYRVPMSIANMHRERIKGKREMLARSRLMQTTPEYTEVQRGMASIDATYGTKSQLGGGAQQEVSDYLVAEEIR